MCSVKIKIKIDYINLDQERSKAKYLNWRRLMLLMRQHYQSSAIKVKIQWLKRSTKSQKSQVESPCEAETNKATLSMAINNRLDYERRVEPRCAPKHRPALESSARRVGGDSGRIKKKTHEGPRHDDDDATTNRKETKPRAPDGPLAAESRARKLRIGPRDGRAGWPSLVLSSRSTIEDKK